MVGAKSRSGCYFILTAIFVCFCKCRCSSDTDGFHDHRFFLQQIFDKYGDKGIITFEGFEHLLESLGLGRLSFEKKHSVSMHRINGSFKDVHDELHLHDHRHGPKEIGSDQSDTDTTVSSKEITHFSETDEPLVRNGDFPTLRPTTTEKSSRIIKRSTVKDPEPGAVSGAPEDDIGLCLSPQALLKTFGLRPNHSVAIKPSRFLHLCPAIVYQLDKRACSVQAAPISVASESKTRRNVSQSEAWLHATLATGLISSVGLLAVLMVKLTKRRSFVHFLVALAVGSLSGDALLHLLPHALLSEKIDHETAALRCGATFLAIISFYGLEGALSLVRTARPERKISELGIPRAVSLELKSVKNHVIGEYEEAGTMLASTHQEHHGHSHGFPAEGNASSSLAFLVLVGDGLHNFTDGLAIGASYASDPVAGLATTIAVFCHELPHELGDFAVLINSGMSVKRALLYNILSSALSFIGAACGVWLGEFEDVTQWIYAATAGTFLYIALADLVPEMMSYVKSDAKFQGIFIQIAGMTLGGLLMLVIAFHEDKLHNLLL